MTTKKNLNENYKCKWLDTLRAIRIFCIWSTVSFLLTFKSRGINSIQKDVKIKDNTKILINKSKILKISMKIFIYPLYWIRIVKTQLNKKMLPHTCFCQMWWANNLIHSGLYWAGVPGCPWAPCCPAGPVEKEI